MITIRKSEDRGRSRLDWLDSRHTFSFADYHDPAHMHFGPIRVLNDDVVGPGAGFGEHPHARMEIITWPVHGALEHRDSTGGGGIVRPGEIQRMSAGRALTHSEYNASRIDPVRFLQIWILPDKTGEDIAPEYEHRAFAEEELRNKLRIVASESGDDGAVRIHRDTTIYAARLDANAGVEHELERFGRAWLQVVTGNVELFTRELAEGDGAALIDEPRVRIHATEPSEVLLFDLGA